MQSHAVRVECPALYISLCASLIFPAYAQLSLLHVEPSLVLSCVVALLEVARVSMFMLQVAKQIETE